MATMKDIADRLGISLGTVSKGLNGGQDISESLRQSILDTAVELGYQSRRAKKTGQRKLALFIENMDYASEDQFGYDIVKGFQKAAFRDGWGVDVISLSHTFQNENRYDGYMVQEKYAGAFFLGLSLDDPWMDQLAETALPTVLLDNAVQVNPHVGSISTDSEEGIDMAISHLVSYGHEKIAFLNGSAGSMVSNLRMSAYLSSISRHQLHIDPNLAVYGYFVADAARYHVPGFLDRGATAILCGNDLIASGVIECVKAAGFSVPEDVSVIGFDDLPLAAALDPPLTTVRQNREELGQSGFFTLYAIMNDVSMIRNYLRPSLIVRGSTAMARPRIAVRREDDQDSVARVNPELFTRYIRQGMM